MISRRIGFSADRLIEELKEFGSGADGCRWAWPCHRMRSRLEKCPWLVRLVAVCSNRRKGSWVIGTCLKSWWSYWLHSYSLTVSILHSLSTKITLHRLGKEATFQQKQRLLSRVYSTLWFESISTKAKTRWISFRSVSSQSHQIAQISWL